MDLLQLQIENNALKQEILTLRVQLANAVMPQLQDERNQLMEQAKKLQAEAQPAPQAQTAETTKE